MAPHVNNWSPLDGAHKSQVTVNSHHKLIIVIDLSLYNDCATLYQ